MAIACWTSVEDWQAFGEREGEPPDPEAFQAMHAVSEFLSAEVFTEVQNLSDCAV
jgi:hypothetical protein